MASPLNLRTAGLTAAAALLVLPVAACSSPNVDCSGNQCSVTLTVDDAKADVLGNSLAFGGVENGRATLSVGDTSVSCAQGEEVAAGPLTLTCTTVTEQSVELTAGLG